MNILTKIVIQKRYPEVDHLEYSNRQCLFNIIDAVQSLQSLMVKNY